MVVSSAPEILPRSKSLFVYAIADDFSMEIVFRKFSFITFDGEGRFRKKVICL